MSNIVQINHEEFGIEETKAKQIAEQFKPMLEKMTELEAEFNEVSKLDIEDPLTYKRAKELRLKYVKVRTGTAEIHKEQKAFYLQAGRFVDGWKNAQIFASQGIEQKLEAIEKHAENKERERLESLQAERFAAVSPYLDTPDTIVLHHMENDVFEAYLSTKKKQYEDKKEAERIAEEQRQEQLRKEAEEREAQRLENIRLKEEAEKREAEIKKEREEAERQAEKIAAENEAKIKAEREAREKIEAEKRAAEAELEAQRKENERIERERLAKIEADKKEAEKLAKAPIKKQLLAWVNDFSIPSTNVNNEVSKEIQSKFGAFKKWAVDKVDTL